MKYLIVLQLFGALMQRSTTKSKVIILKSMLLLLILFSSIGISNAQNPPDAYIYDGSFETTNVPHLPPYGYTSPKDFHANWKNSQDLDVTCLVNTNCETIGSYHWVPINEYCGLFDIASWWNYQWPVFYDANNDPTTSGKPDETGYVGLIFKKFSSGGGSYYKEYIWQELQRDLKPETKYYLTFYASLAKGEEYNENTTSGDQSNDGDSWCFKSGSNYLQVHHLKKLGAYFSANQILTSAYNPLVVPDQQVQVYSDRDGREWLNEVGGWGNDPNKPLYNNLGVLQVDNIPATSNWMKIKSDFISPLAEDGILTHINIGNFQESWTATDLNPYSELKPTTEICYLIDGVHLCGCEDGDGTDGVWGAYGVRLALEEPTVYMQDCNNALRIFLDERACQINKVIVFKINEHGEEEFLWEKIHPTLFDYETHYIFNEPNQMFTSLDGTETYIVRFYNTIEENSEEVICEFTRQVNCDPCTCPSYQFDINIDAVDEQDDVDLCRYNISLTPSTNSPYYDYCLFDEIKIFEISFENGTEIKNIVYDIKNETIFQPNVPIFISPEYQYSPTDPTYNLTPTLQFEYYYNGEYICKNRSYAQCRCSTEVPETQIPTDLSIRVEVSDLNPSGYECCWDVFLDNPGECHYHEFPGITNALDADDYPGNLIFTYYDGDWTLDTYTNGSETFWYWNSGNNHIFPNSSVKVGSFCTPKDGNSKNYIFKRVKFPDSEEFTDPTTTNNVGCVNCCEFVSITFADATVENGVCCWTPVKNTTKPIDCPTSDIIVTYKQGEDILTLNAAGKICLDASSSHAISYEIEINGDICGPYYTELVCDECQCPQENTTMLEWISVEADVDEVSCDPDECAVVATIDLPDEYDGCFTHISSETLVFEYVSSNGGYLVLEPRDEKPFNTPVAYADGVIPNTTFCIGRGEEMQMQIRLYKNGPGSNYCTITTDDIGCWGFDLDPRTTACTPDEPENQWDEEGGEIDVFMPAGCESEPGLNCECIFAVQYTTRLSGVAPDEYQDIQMTLVGADSEECSDNYDLESIFKEALPKAIADKLYEDEDWQPNNSSDNCTDIWRVVQNTCWSSWLIASTHYGSSHLRLPCESDCCIKQLRVCKNGLEVTVSDMGYVNGSQYNCNTAVAELPPELGDYTLTSNGCDNFDCSMYEYWHNSYTGSKNNEPNYEEKKGRFITPPRNPEKYNFLDDSNSPYMIYKTNHYNSKLEITIKKSTFDQIDINIVNVQGQSLISNLSFELNGGSQILEINTESLVNGVYFYNIVSDSQIVGTGKFIKID
jgi:hypothetical protein